MLLFFSKGGVLGPEGRGLVSPKLCLLKAGQRQEQSGETRGRIPADISGPSTEDPAPDSQQLHPAQSKAAVSGQAGLLREQTVEASSSSHCLPSAHVMVNIIDLTGSRITMETDL